MPSTVITIPRVASSPLGAPAFPGGAQGGQPEIKPVLKRFVLQVTVAYALLSAVWIAFSDWVLASLPLNGEWMTRISTLKGWVFVGVTAMLLYETLRRGLRQLEQATKSYVDSQSAMRQWAAAFTNCAHGITICDPATNRIVACNPAFARMHRCTVDEIVGTSAFERYDESMQETARRSTTTADQTGRASLEALVRRKDNSTFHAQMDWVTVRDEGGTLLYRVTTIQDITERKRAEQALRESESGMAAAQRVGGFGSWELDLSDQENLIDNALRWSDQCYRIFGYMPNEMPVTVRLFLGHVHPEDREMMIARAQAAIRTEERFESEHRIVLRGGEVRFVREAGEVIRDRDSGRAVKFVGTVHDTTARLEAAAALQESEARFRAVVENIHEVFWMSSAAKDEVLYISPSYAQVWGRSPESVYQNPLGWLDTIHEEDRERIKSTYREKQRAGNYDEEYRIVRPDGQIRWVRAKAFPVRGANGEIERIVGLAEDTTERKTLEAQFLRAQRMEAIGTLAGGIAHDLNNILAPMLMAAGLLKENTRDVHDREMLGMVERGARRGSEIIRQLLTFSRGVSGERVPIEVRHLLKEMGAIVRETFPREIALSENTPRTLWPVVADATQLHQVLVNLCVNARDAMPRGGKLSLFAENVTLAEGDLREHAEARPGPYVMLGVTDTGTGIAPELMDRIFDPFFTTKDLGKGTGLGLSTVLGIVRSHAGFVAVESKMGAGSAFRVYLPAAAPAEIEERAAPQSGPFPSGQGELILVVDDEEAIRESTRHALETHNYRVLTASNGKEAVTRFLQQRQGIRLVLTDMMMPEMGGTALIRALRLLNPAVRVVATSGLQPDGNQEELEKLGIKEVLPKPCGPRALLEAVRRQLA